MGRRRTNNKEDSREQKDKVLHSKSEERDANTSILLRGIMGMKHPFDQMHNRMHDRLVLTRITENNMIKTNK